VGRCACAVDGRKFDTAAAGLSRSIKAVIYCVVPEPLADELLDKLTNYYADDPNVTVIVDRRKRSRRRGPGSSGGGNRELRDRRRPRVTGELPDLTSE
jgi:hypothetical protein